MQIYFTNTLHCAIFINLYYILGLFSTRDNLHEMSNPVSVKNKKKNHRFVVCWKFYPEGETLISMTLLLLCLNISGEITVFLLLFFLLLFFFFFFFFLFFCFVLFCFCFFFVAFFFIFTCFCKVSIHVTQINKSKGYFMILKDCFCC